MRKSLCLVLIILLTAGCAPISISNGTSSAQSESSSTSSYTPPVVSQTFERDQSESEEFTGDWVVNIVYTRENVIAGQFKKDSVVPASREFTEDFISNPTEPFGVTDFNIGDYSISGNMNIVSGVFYRDAGVYLAEYPVSFKTVSEVPGLENQIFLADEQKFDCLVWIQVVLKQEPHGGSLLLGFVTNQNEQISTYAQLYSFLCEDPSYDSAFYTPPEIFEAPDAISISKILGGRNVSDAVMLPDGNIAMLLYELDESDSHSAVQYYLKIFEPDFQTAINVVRLWKAHANAEIALTSDGNILACMTQYNTNDDGSENTIYYERRFDEKGKELSSIEKSGDYSYLSDENYILQDSDGSLYLVRDSGEFKLLMAGIIGEDPYGMDSWVYRFDTRIDDTHFTYRYGGYESSETKGVYDIESRTTTAFPVQGYYNCTQTHDRKYAACTTVNYDEDQYDLYLCTLGASEAVLISRGNEKSDGSLPMAFSEDGSYFAFAERTGKSTYNITVIDTEYTWIAAQITIIG